MVISSSELEAYKNIPNRLVISVLLCDVNSKCIDDCRDIFNVTRPLRSARINVLLHVFHFQSFVFKFRLIVFRLWLCSWWDVFKLGCKIGKFTIRDAILFHKFCIFNKEYFVFLPHRMFVWKCLFGACLCVLFVVIILILFSFIFYLFTRGYNTNKYIFSYILKKLNFLHHIIFG